MSGLVKGVKKVFKAIGNAVKKVMKTTIGKILVGALAIFTGGAALAAFGAMGAGATFGSVMSAAVAGGAETAGGHAAGRRRDKENQGDASRRSPHKG